MEIMDYVIEEALVIIPVLMILGKFLKETELGDRYIPLILLVISIVFALLIIGVTVEAAIQGVLVAGAAVFGHQALKQIKDK
ncbi:phage holin family protein [Alkalibacillus sp. S2W]|uniref:phage holin family protein n=1 Tax=Alkalibacillus sp. S2W TaxID=3386553 RepID=UPI00398D2B17